MTTFEPVPTTRTSLALDAGRLLSLSRLPEGIGFTAHDGRLSLHAESDGKGGVSITAQHEGESRKVITEEKEETNRIRDESASDHETKVTKAPLVGRLWLVPVSVLVLTALYAAVKRCLKMKNEK